MNFFLDTNAVVKLYHQAVPVDYFFTADKKLLRIAKVYFPAFNPGQPISQ